MPARILNGTETARELRQEVAKGVKQLHQRRGVTPGLAAILTGDNAASATYVRNKERACQEAGVFTQTFHLPHETSEGELCSLVERLNQDPRFHGILVQLPLPPHLDPQRVIAALSPEKDVDALHPVNAGLLAQGRPRFVPCTPAGIQHLLLRGGYSPEGKHVVVCGRSDIVGKPLALLLMQKATGANATVTVCHTGTRDLGGITRQADILVAAMGSPRAITAEMVKEGAVVIDVGMNRVEDATAPRGYRLVGDVAFEEVSQKAAAITPVPGGVGPMTVAMLVRNTLLAAQHSVGQA